MPSVITANKPVVSRPESPEDGVQQKGVPTKSTRQVDPGRDQSESIKKRPIHTGLRIKCSGTITSRKSLPREPVRRWALQPVLWW